MDDLESARTLLSRQLAEAIATDPLLALTTIGAVQRDITEHQCTAVRAAALDHSWAEIGEALGVSKQAAHQKFAKEWAETLSGELKAEHGSLKSALRAGETHRAATAKVKRDAIISEFKAARAANRKRK